MASKESFGVFISEQPVAVMLLRNYVNVQLPHSKNGNAHHYEELTEPSQKGLGVTLDSIFFQRSMNSICSGIPAYDLSYLYSDISNPNSWRTLDDLKHHLKTDKGSFHQGVSYKDGFIFGMDRGKVETLVGKVSGNSDLLFYHHKIVGGEPRGEFFSLMMGLYASDMESTLRQLIDIGSIGSGTTSQISDQCFGALLAGPYCQTKQYRMRKTKISETIDIGHMMIYYSTLSDKAVDLLAAGGYDFSKALDPSENLLDIVSNLYGAFLRSGISQSCHRPRDLYNLRSELIYAEYLPSSGGNRIFCKTSKDSSSSLIDITDELIDLRILEMKRYGA